jgi:hypothetical protein
MEFVLYFERFRRFLMHGLRDLEDSGFGGIYVLFVTREGDFSLIASTLLDVDLHTRALFDFIDRRTGSTEDAWDSACRNGELDFLVGLFLKLVGLYHRCIRTTRTFNSHSNSHP